MACWRDIKNNKMTDSEVILKLQEAKLLQTFGICINCEDDELIEPRTNRIKCKSCDVEWSIRKGSILEESKISLKSFLLLYHLYLDGISSHKASIIAKVNKNTSLKFFKKFRDL